MSDPDRRGNRSDSEDCPDAPALVDRRTMVQLSAVATASNPAGCTADFDDGEVKIGTGDDDQETPTPTFRHDGTRTGTYGAGTPTDSTGTTTRPSAPDDDYGVQTYRQYEYGGQPRHHDHHPIMPQTPNHGYNVPNECATDWHIPLNENFESYDTDIEIRDGDANKDDNGDVFHDR